MFIIFPGLKTVDQPLESQLQQRVTLNLHSELTASHLHSSDETIHRGEKKALISSLLRFSGRKLSQTQTRAQIQYLLYIKLHVL